MLPCKTTTNHHFLQRNPFLLTTNERKDLSPTKKNTNIHQVGAIALLNNWGLFRSLLHIICIYMYWNGIKEIVEKRYHCCRHLSRELVERK